MNDGVLRIHATNIYHHDFWQWRGKYLRPIDPTHKYRLTGQIRLAPQNTATTVSMTLFSVNVGIHEARSNNMDGWYLRWYGRFDAVKTLTKEWHSFSAEGATATGKPLDSTDLSTINFQGSYPRDIWVEYKDIKLTDLTVGDGVNLLPFDFYNDDGSQYLIDTKNVSVFKD